MIRKSHSTPLGTMTYWLEPGDAPDAPVLVFLHGLSADHTLFEPQIEHFRGHYTLLVWDAPCHGQSRPHGQFNYADAVAELKTILDLEHIGPAVMIGQSMGGYVIQSLLRRDAARVKAFVGIDTCPYGTQYYSRSDLWWLRQMDWMSRCYPVKTMKNAVARQVGCSEPTRQNMRAALQCYTKDELCCLMGAGYGDFVNENCDLVIKCPVCLIVGEQDKTGKVLQYCKQWQEATGYPLHIIPGAAHNANFDKPDQVNKILEDFMATLP